MNTDVLSWLLRPVPFVTGLPSSSPVAPACAPEENDRAATSNNDMPVGQEREDNNSEGVDVVFVPTGDASGAGGEEKVVERIKGHPTGEVHSSSSTTVKERRATPVPTYEGAREGEDGSNGSSGGKGSNKRAGFHAYDETHQVVYHAPGTSSGILGIRRRV